MHGRELPALCPAAASLGSISRGEVVYGGAQVEPPGGMKGKNGAVTSTYHLYTFFPPLCLTLHLASLSTCSVHTCVLGRHPLYPLLSTPKTHCTLLAQDRMADRIEQWI